MTAANTIIAERPVTGRRAIMVTQHEKNLCESSLLTPLDSDSRFYDFAENRHQCMFSNLIFPRPLPPSLRSSRDHI